MKKQTLQGLLPAKLYNQFITCLMATSTHSVTFTADMKFNPPVLEIPQINGPVTILFDSERGDMLIEEVSQRGRGKGGVKGPTTISLTLSYPTSRRSRRVRFSATSKAMRGAGSKLTATK